MMCCSSIFILVALLPYWAEGNISVLNKVDGLYYCERFEIFAPGSLLNFIECGLHQNKYLLEWRPRSIDKLMPFKICTFETLNCIGIDENRQVRLLEAKENDNLNDSFLWSLLEDGQLLNQSNDQCLRVDFPAAGSVNMVDCEFARDNHPEGFNLDIPIHFRTTGNKIELNELISKYGAVTEIVE